MQKAARPCSMILVLIFVFGVVAAVMFVLVPQLGNTFFKSREKCSDISSTCTGMGKTSFPQ